MYWRPNRHEFKFRDGPVPYTRCHRGGFGMFRRPRTFQVIRAEYHARLDAIEDDIDLGTAKRYPTSWDDIARSSPEKSWKKQRRHQWRR